MSAVRREASHWPQPRFSANKSRVCKRCEGRAERPPHSFSPVRRYTTMRLSCKRPHEKAAATEPARASKMSEAVRTMMRMDAEAAQESAAQTDAGFLWDFWYPAVRSTEIAGKKLAAAMLLEVPLVLGRTSEGKGFAMRDSCPHRGMPLSYGRHDGKVVEGSYHGWPVDAGR